MPGSIRNLKSYFILLAILAIAVLPFVASIYIVLDRAETAFGKKDYALAADYYKQAALKMPWKVELWDEAGRSSYLAGDFTTAIESYTEARQRNGLTASGWIFFGEIYLSRAQAGEALETWHAGLTQYPVHSEFHWYISKAYRFLGDYGSEKDDLGTWIRAGQADAEAHYRFAQLLALSDLDQALDELRLAEQLHPGYASVVNTLKTSIHLAGLEQGDSARLVVVGRGLGLVNEWPLAAEAFKEAVHADERNAEAWAWLGEAKGQLGADGLSELDQALILNERSAVVRALRGLYWKRHQNFRRSLTEYRSASELEPLNPVWQASLGESYYSLGDLPSALLSYQRATELAPKETIYWRLLAVFCAETGVNIEEVGLPAAQKAVDLNPEDPLALDTLGLLYLSSGRYSLAERTLQQAIAQDSEEFIYYPAHLHLAMTFLAQGNAIKAYAELTFLRDGNPDPSTAALVDRLLEQYYP